MGWTEYLILERVDKDDITRPRWSILTPDGDLGLDLRSSRSTDDEDSSGAMLKVLRFDLLDG
jgi:hypothetical protein